MTSEVLRCLSAWLHTRLQRLFLSAAVMGGMT